MGGGPSWDERRRSALMNVIGEGKQCQGDMFHPKSRGRRGGAPQCKQGHVRDRSPGGEGVGGVGEGEE